VGGDTRHEADAELRGFAGEHSLSVAAARSLLDALRALAGAEQFYIFWTSGSSAGASGAGRQRILLAFPTPDAALTFAQRNQLAKPRLRRLSLLQLINAMLRKPAIGALLIVDDDDADRHPPAGRLPHGTRLERADLLRRLQESA
jgi:hypothetical protein